MFVNQKTGRNFPPTLQPRLHKYSVTLKRQSGKTSRFMPARRECATPAAISASHTGVVFYETHMSLFVSCAGNSLSGSFYKVTQVLHGACAIYYSGSRLNK